MREVFKLGSIVNRCLRKEGEVEILHVCPYYIKSPLLLYEFLSFLEYCIAKLTDHYYWLCCDGGMFKAGKIALKTHEYSCLITRRVNYKMLSF